MTRLILPQMVHRKKGALINISSTGGTMCVPLLSVYSGTKAYVDKFTEGLEYEYRSKGVTIQCILPGNSKLPMPIFTVLSSVCLRLRRF